MGASEPGRVPTTYASVARVRPSAAKQGVTAVVPGFDEFKKISDASSRVATSTTKPPTNGSTTTLAKLKDGWAIDGWNGDSATQPSIPRPPSSGHKVFAEEESDEFKRSGRGSEDQARACVDARRAALASLLASHMTRAPHASRLATPRALKLLSHLHYAPSTPCAQLSVEDAKKCHPALQTVVGEEGFKNAAETIEEVRCQAA